MTFSISISSVSASPTIPLSSPQDASVAFFICSTSALLIALGLFIQLGIDLLLGTDMTTVQPLVLAIALLGWLYFSLLSRFASSDSVVEMLDLSDFKELPGIPVELPRYKIDPLGNNAVNLAVLE